MDYVGKIMKAAEKSERDQKEISMRKLLGLNFSEDFLSEFLLLKPSVKIV